MPVYMEIDAILNEYNNKFTEAEEITKKANEKEKDYNLQEVIDYIDKNFPGYYDAYDSKSIDIPDNVKRIGSVIIYEYDSYGYIDILGLTTEDFEKIEKMIKSKGSYTEEDL